MALTQEYSVFHMANKDLMANVVFLICAQMLRWMMFAENFEYINSTTLNSKFQLVKYVTRMTSPAS